VKSSAIDDLGGRGAHQPPWYHAGLSDAAFEPRARLSNAALPFLSLLVPLALGSGCATPAPQTPIGMSDAAAEREPRQVPKPPPGPPWPYFASALTWPEAALPFRALAHRRDGALIHVRVDPSVPEALASYRTLSVESSLPDGTRIIAWHETNEGRLLGGYLLEKRDRSWSALEVDAQGSVISGDRAPCMRCHDMAPTDHLFGLPASAAPRAEPTSADHRPSP